MKKIVFCLIALLSQYVFATTLDQVIAFYEMSGIGEIEQATMVFESDSFMCKKNIERDMTFSGVGTSAITTLSVEFPWGCGYKAKKLKAKFSCYDDVEDCTLSYLEINFGEKEGISYEELKYENGAKILIAVPGQKILKVYLKEELLDRGMNFTIKH